MYRVSGRIRSHDTSPVIYPGHAIEIQHQCLSTQNYNPSSSQGLGDKNAGVDGGRAWRRESLSIHGGSDARTING